MTPFAAIARYQVRELSLRWRSQPASPLARWFLTFALAAAAAVLLLGFAAAESARRAELRRLGLDTVVVQSPSSSILTGEEALPPDHWAAPLAAGGDLRLLQQLPLPAYTPWGEPVAAFVGDRNLNVNLNLNSEGEPRTGAWAFWLTHTLPPGRIATVTLGGLPIRAVTAAPTGSLEALGLEDFLLISPDLAPPGSSPNGRLDVVLFTPASGGDRVAAIRRLFADEGGPVPLVRDPAPYRRALEAFTHSQNRWRSGMAFLLCLCVVLAFGSIGMLEEKQTRYTQALLRSLGVSGAALWAFSLIENLLLANSALLAALFGSRLAASGLLSLAGAQSAGPVGIGGPALLWLACAVNAGVVLSLMPLARALRRPVGIVLP